jgi:hypothetical protein
MTTKVDAQVLTSLNDATMTLKQKKRAIAEKNRAYRNRMNDRLVSSLMTLLHDKGEDEVKKHMRKRIDDGQCPCCDVNSKGRMDKFKPFKNIRRHVMDKDTPCCQNERIFNLAKDLCTAKRRRLFSNDDDDDDDIDDGTSSDEEDDEDDDLMTLLLKGRDKVLSIPGRNDVARKSQIVEPSSRNGPTDDEGSTSMKAYAASLWREIELLRPFAKDVLNPALREIMAANDAWRKKVDPSTDHTANKKKRVQPVPVVRTGVSVANAQVQLELRRNKHTDEYLDMAPAFDGFIVSEADVE